MLLSIFLAIALLSLSYMFALSAVHKLGNTEQFQQVLADYKLLPPALIPLLSRVLPVIELLTAIGLLVAPLRPLALAAACALLLTYALAMSINIARGRSDIDCGCHGPHRSQKIGVWSVVRNISLIVLILLQWKYSALLPFSAASWGVAWGGTALVTLFLHAFAQLQTNRQLIAEISHHG